MPAKGIMVLGTASGVGKSFLSAGLCRVLSGWGYRAAPFKAQNMSNNSYVTEGGGEMGRAQAVQAECARVKPHVDMNPVLLKPAADNFSQVILQGRSLGHFRAQEYYGMTGRLRQAVAESYKRLAQQYDVIVIEGAGSPAEINLKEHDFVNMKMAALADADCLLVGDIDRGGVFASLLGTLDLLEPEERARIKGLVINRFRGDRSLLENGLRLLEARSGKPLWGVLPLDAEIILEEEDSLILERENPEFTGRPGNLDIAVLFLPRLSNFTDFDVLSRENGVRLRYIKRLSEFGRPDLLILPGTKATIADFRYLQEKGFCDTILRYAEDGGRILGICGGYQIMGRRICDPEGMESLEKEVEGLGFFEMTTTFAAEKKLHQVREIFEGSLFGEPARASIQAYEIHMGRTAHHQSYELLGREGALHPNGRWLGTYYHGLWDDPTFRKSFLDALRKSLGREKKAEPLKVKPADLSISSYKEVQYERLADLLRRHLNLALLRKLLPEPILCP